MKKFVPTMKCKDIGRDQWAFYCPYCKREHIHGAVGDGGTDRRVAHCHSSSPYWESGYYLKLEDE